MSRIYEGGAAANRYREGDVGRAYQSVKAVDSSKQMQEWKKRNIEEQAVKTRSLERELRLENVELSAQQKAESAHQKTQQIIDLNEVKADQLWETNTMKLDHYHQQQQQALDMAELKAKHQVQNANFAAMRTAVSSLLSFAGSAAKFAGTMGELQAAEAAKEQAIADDIAQESWLFGDINVEGLDEQANTQLDVENAEEAAVSSMDLDPVQGEMVRRDMGYEQTHARNVSSMSVGEAAMRADGDLQAAWYDPETRVDIPGLGSVRPTDVPLEFVDAAAIQIAKQITTKHGIGRGGRDNLHAAAKQYAPAMRSAMGRLTAVVRRDLVAGGKANREMDGYSSADVYRSNTGDAQGSWNRYFSAAMENAGGDRVKATGAALDAYIMNASESELRQLEQVRVFEGGPTFANDKRYKDMIATAIQKRQSQGVQRYNTQASIRKQEVANAQNAFTEALMNADTPEATEAAHQSYERALQAMANAGNTEARKELIEQQSAKNPNTYNPRNAAVLQERVQAGEVLTKEFLDGELRSGRINSSEYNVLSKGATTTVANKHKTYGGKDQYNAANQMVQNRLTTALQDDLGLIDNEQIKDATARMKVDMIQRRDAAVAQFVRNQGGEASPEEVQQFSDAWIDKNVPALLKGVSIDEETGVVKGYTRMGATSSGVASPVYNNIYTGKEARDYSSLSVGQLTVEREAGTRIDTANSKVLTTAERNAAIKAYATGGSIPDSVVRKANALGMDEYELTRQQAAAAGFKIAPQPTAPVPEVQKMSYSGGDNVSNSRAGRDLIHSMGVPRKGAAWLSGNIQQESGWNGQRSWGAVYNPTTGQMDGTSRNGGLVSWASWSDDPARLGKIESYLGKSIEQASDVEQVKAMLWEMETSYPSAYRTFMNPNSSDAQLRRASKQYWGYGHEGARFAYARELL